MNIWQALFLGIVQGISEFLPISSSGHLVLLQNWMAIYPPPIYLDLLLHVVSVLVIIYYFRRILVKLNSKLAKQLIISTLPLIVVGLLFRTHIFALFGSNLIVGIGLIITGALNFYASYQYRTDKKTNLTTKKSLWIGLTQALAAIPGISRSGSTLFGASVVDIDKEQAFEFSFLMAILAILIASFGELLLINTGSLQPLHQISFVNYLASAVICFITSLLSLKFLKFTLDKAKYHYFGWYCLIIGATAILLTF